MAKPTRQDMENVCQMLDKVLDASVMWGRQEDKNGKERMIVTLYPSLDFDAQEVRDAVDAANTDPYSLSYEAEFSEPSSYLGFDVRK